MSLNEILNEAVPAWTDLTGTKLGSNKFSFHVGSSSEFQEYDLKKYVDDLNTARVSDPSGTTAILLLRGLFKAYVEEQAFTAHALLYDRKKVDGRISQFERFRALIAQLPCEDAVAAFRDTTRDATKHYGYDLGKLGEHLGSDRTLGELRLAAARSCERLAVHQFAQGEPGMAPIRYNRQIFEFTSINSFLHALQHQWVAGITLALIRDSKDDRGVYKAYFVLGLRDGQSITILTDHEEGAHPDYGNITRRPDRRLEERARQHWFPYRLLNDDPVKRKKREKALVPLDERAVAVSTVSDLEPSEFLWLTLLFDLVMKKYSGAFRAENLSYTAQMIVEPHALIPATNTLVRAGHYRPLVLPKLTRETTTWQAAGNLEPVGHNAWMEDRYGDRVPEVLLQVVGDQEALAAGKAAAKQLPGKISLGELPQMRRERGVMGWWPDHRMQPLVPRGLDPTSFGTAEKLDQDRVWNARVNKIQAVQRFAVAEFVQKSKLIQRWYRARIERNLPFLLRAMIEGKLTAPTLRWSDRDGGFPTHDQIRWGTDNILDRGTGKHWRDAMPRCLYSGGIHFGDWDGTRGRGYVTCFRDPPTRASVFSSIDPDNYRALALLCGIPEEKLPWPLQNWMTHEPYTRNSILDRVDPQDSRLDNPWRHLDLRITIALCKREYKKLQKEYAA